MVLGLAMTACTLNPDEGALVGDDSDGFDKSGDDCGAADCDLLHMGAFRGVLGVASYMLVCEADACRLAPAIVEDGTQARYELTGAHAWDIGAFSGRRISVEGIPNHETEPPQLAAVRFVPVVQATQDSRSGRLVPGDQFGGVGLPFMQTPFSTEDTMIAYSIRFDAASEAVRSRMNFALKGIGGAEMALAGIDNGTFTELIFDADIAFWVKAAVEDTAAGLELVVPVVPAGGTPGQARHQAVSSGEFDLDAVADGKLRWYRVMVDLDTAYNSVQTS
jgi:hypothetical protein